MRVSVGGRWMIQSLGYVDGGDCSCVLNRIFLDSMNEFDPGQDQGRVFKLGDCDLAVHFSGIHPSMCSCSPDTDHSILDTKATCVPNQDVSIKIITEIYKRTPKLTRYLFILPT